MPPLNHLLASSRPTFTTMFENGDFGAHTMAVARMLSVTRINPIELFAYGEQYLPRVSDLPHDGIAAYFKMMSMLLSLSTAQRELVLDAEAYCRSSAESLALEPESLRQRFVWERSPELPDPFDE